MVRVTEVERTEMEPLGGEIVIAEKISQAADKLVEDVQLLESYYKWRGLCKKCGWQTFQYERDQAHQLVKRHAVKHWRELMTDEQQAQSQAQGAQHSAHAAAQHHSAR